ncbi:TVP38/TMEM64 family protein [Nocardioides sp.]|uniref:TVP38/TMEM64 family protein n=1 Tax=Nocardioides sp. TaxID=35761 RepID=UPI0035185678
MTGSASERRGALLRLGGLVLVFVAVAVGVQLSGWDGPEQLREAVEGAGAWGPVLYVLGYAALVLVPTPASVLTILAGALFGLLEGVLLAWLGALLGAVGGFAIGRRLGRPAGDRLLGGRLAQADRVLAHHGLPAVLAVRLVPVFPFTPLNYAAGLVGVRFRHYLLGSALGMLPGATAYAAVGASGANPLGIVVAVAGLVLLVVVGGWWGRRLLRREGVDPDQE